MTTQRLNRSPRPQSTHHTEADANLVNLLRRHPGGLTRSQIARQMGLRYDAVDPALARLERRGILLCEDDGLITVYQH